MNDEQYARHVANLSHSGGVRKPMTVAEQPQPTGPSPRDFDVIVELLTPLLQESGSKRRLLELRAAIQDSKIASDKLARERADYDLHRAERDAEHAAKVVAKTEELDARESSLHAAQEAFHSERDVEHKRIAALSEAAQRDREQAANMLATARRRINAFEGTA